MAFWKKWPPNIVRELTDGLETDETVPVIVVEADRLALLGRLGILGVGDRHRKRPGEVDFLQVRRIDGNPVESGGLDEVDRLEVDFHSHRHALLLLQGLDDGGVAAFHLARATLVFIPGVRKTERMMN